MKSIILLFAFGFSLFCSSCTINKVQVGNYDASKNCETSVYKKSKDVYLFWHIIPIQRVERRLPIKDYEKVVSRGFFDAVLYYGSVGVFSFTTVQINTQTCPPEEAN